MIGMNCGCTGFLHRPCLFFFFVHLILFTAFMQKSRGVSSWIHVWLLCTNEHLGTYWWKSIGIGIGVDSVQSVVLVKWNEMKKSNSKTAAAHYIIFVFHSCECVNMIATDIYGVEIHDEKWKIPMDNWFI